ncbi:unnamed protein product [Lepeophtheirus salmonis]|uniref:(salmon louse) hypothetical protein n=1 Tax=Lepeophtheirus salmonis TaxID=72036 RepID=A0A817FAR2_LEPSM|nr:unnamed protein product [Lepeophtheirus salmonis]CAG9475332.1 unnamed protein product [Lepeophtheirus salmonis]
MNRVISSAISSENELLRDVKEDASLCITIEAARTGDWSKVTKDSYKKNRHAFSLKNGLLFWGIRLTIPSSLSSNNQARLIGPSMSTAGSPRPSMRNLLKRMTHSVFNQSMNKRVKVSMLISGIS